MDRRCARCGLLTETFHPVVFNVSGNLHEEEYCGRCWLILDGRPRGPFRVATSPAETSDAPPEGFGGPSLT